MKRMWGIMSRCSRCGRKKLFMRLSERGLCPECEATQKRADIAARVDVLCENYEKMVAQCEKASAKLAAEEKKLETAKKKAQPFYDWMNSVKYAMEAYPESGKVPSEMLETDLTEYIENAPPLNCLTLKNLRAKYKQNEKLITSLVREYEMHYTAKTNAAIFKLMVLALQAEFWRIISNITYGEFGKSVDEVTTMTARYSSIAVESRQIIASSLLRFIKQLEYYYIEAVKIEYEYYMQRERAKEEQKAIREQMRQEAEERKALEAQRKQVENEEKKYTQEMERVSGQLKAVTDDAEVQKLKNRLAELEQQLSAVSERKEEIVALQNGKAGTVYIISNIGSFGDDVFKVGMTRRLEPQDRVNELGDASVPFPFDVHSFIFSEDAVALETALHKALNEKRVNKVNLRKEFFRVSLDELEQLVEKIDPTAPFQRTVLAEQYKQSLSLAEPLPDVPVDDED